MGAGINRIVDVTPIAKATRRRNAVRTPLFAFAFEPEVIEDCDACCFACCLGLSSVLWILLGLRTAPSMPGSCSPAGRSKS